MPSDNINLWPTPTRGHRLGDRGANKAKALLRRLDAEKSTKETALDPKDGYSQIGIKRSGIAGRRGRSNFLFAVRAKNLIKKLGL